MLPTMQGAMPPDPHRKWGLRPTSLGGKPPKTPENQAKREKKNLPPPGFEPRTSGWKSTPLPLSYEGDVQIWVYFAIFV